MKKELLFLVRRAPVGSGWASEALRVAVGMTLADGDQLTVVLMGPGVLALRPQRPEAVGALDIRQHIETLRETGVRLVAEQEACARHGIPPGAAETADRDAIAEMAAQAEVLYLW